MKEIFSYETIKLLKKVEKIRDSMHQDSKTQYELFKLLSKNPEQISSFVIPPEIKNAPSLESVHIDKLL